MKLSTIQERFNLDSNGYIIEDSNVGWTDQKKVSNYNKRVASAAKARISKATKAGRDVDQKDVNILYNL